MVSFALATTVRAVAALTVVGLLSTCVGLSMTYEPPRLGTGTMVEPAENETVVSVQGFHFQGQGNEKKPARLLVANETGNVTELLNGSDTGVRWFYDVDPVGSGHLLVTATVPGDTVVFELDLETGERVWTERFDAHDTHDVDTLSEHELVVANMRATPDDGSAPDDRIFVYNRTTDEVVWEWLFRNHYPASTDGGYDDDWTHVNDVDPIGESHFLVSPRNFDQVIVVDRTTGEIALRLGEDDNYSILREQHNPDFLRGPDGRPTILVADSDNDRVVEYARTNGTWERVWELGEDQFNWPRDADRLPNGNTLVTDSMNHRVVEVTPHGEIVWEVHTPWGPYDAERVHTGDGSSGPTMQELGVEGSYNLTEANASAADNGSVTGGADGAGRATPADDVDSGGPTTFPEWLQRTFAGTPVADPVDAFAERWEGASQWVKPVWMAPWGFVALVAALCLTVVWGLAEVVVRRRRIYGLLPVGTR